MTSFSSSPRSDSSQQRGRAPVLTLGGMLANLVKAYMGTGLLGIPFAIEKAGFLAGLLSLCVICFLLNHTMKMLLRIKIHVDQELAKQGRERSERHSLEQTSSRECRQIRLKATAPDDRPLLEDSSESEAGLDEISSTGISHAAVDEEAGPSERNDSTADESKSSKGKSLAGFPEIGRFCFGDRGALCINLAVLGTNVGIATGYLLIISKLTKETFKDPKDGTVPIWLMPYQSKDADSQSLARNLNTILVLLSGPLGWLVTMDVSRLNFTSLLGNIAVLGMLGLSVFISLSVISSSKDIAPITPVVGNATNYFAAFGTFMFSFVMHGTVLSQYDSLPETPYKSAGSSFYEQRQKPFRILNTAASLVAALYCCYAAAAYLAFSHGRGMKDNIMDTLLHYSSPDLFPKRYRVVVLTNILLAAAVFCSIPLFLAPVWTLIGLDGDTKKNRSSTMGRVGVVFVLITVANLVDVDKAQLVISLVGALCMSWLGCILPSAFYLKVAKIEREKNQHTSLEGEERYQFRADSRDGLFCAITLVVGVIGMVAGSKGALEDLFF